MGSTRQSLIRLILLVVTMQAPWLFAQNPQLKTKNGRRFPTIVFNWVRWRAQPSYYSIAIDSTGASTYQSAPTSDERTGVPYTMEFQISNRTLRTTFNLLRRLDFLTQVPSLDLSSPEKAAVETLAYEDGAISRQITYSSSPDGDVEELTSVFEEVSETLEFGRRLADSRQREPARLTAELDGLEQKAERHLLRELEALEPLLKSIAADQMLAVTTRQRAQEIIERIDHPHAM